MAQECSLKVYEDASNQQGLCCSGWERRFGFSSWDLFAFLCDLRRLIDLFGTL